MNAAKFWLKSKTILFNLVLALGGSWAAVEASLGNLKEALTPMQYGLLMAGIGVAGVLLRSFTTSAVTTKKQ